MDRPPRRRAWPWAAAGVLAAGIAAGVQLWPSASAVPTARWIDDRGKPLPAVATVPRGSRIVLQLELRQPSHAYVASYSPSDGLIACFPSPFLRRDAPLHNPLPAGAQPLPGAWQGVELRWPVGIEPGSITYMAVVSREPLPEVEAELAHMRSIGNAVFGNDTMGTYLPKDPAAMPGRGTLPSGALRAAFELTEVAADGAMTPWGEGDGVFIAALRVLVE
jgi:hypothetical protein